MLNSREIRSTTISIHALLAESDALIPHQQKCRDRFLSTLSLRRATLLYHFCPVSDKHFYPRSPCGERPKRASCYRAITCISIHALLAESDPQRRFCSRLHIVDFYPRSPCGERQLIGDEIAFEVRDFYPRSPCGERRWILGEDNNNFKISIHALLAESDSALIIQSRLRS